MIVTRNTTLKISQLRGLINDLVGDLDFVPTRETPECPTKGILDFTKDVEARYHVIQFLKESELVLKSYNQTKDELLRNYLKDGESTMSPNHPEWDDFYQKLIALLSIEVSISIPKIPIEKFSGISGEGNFAYFYEYIIGNKSWEISSQLTELQKKMREVTMLEPESTQTTEEEKPSKASPKSITLPGLDGRKSKGLNTLLDSRK